MISHETTIKWEDDFGTKRQIIEWLADSQIPASARITPIITTKGHQRDPYSVLSGLKASWTT